MLCFILDQSSRGLHRVPTRPPPTDVHETQKSPGLRRFATDLSFRTKMVREYACWRAFDNGNTRLTLVFGDCAGSIPLRRFFCARPGSGRCGENFAAGWVCLSAAAARSLDASDMFLMTHPCSLRHPQPSNKSLKIKKILGKKQKQNRPVPQWIRLRTDNKIRYVASPAPRRVSLLHTSHIAGQRCAWQGGCRTRVASLGSRRPMPACAATSRPASQPASVPSVSRALDLSSHSLFPSSHCSLLAPVQLEQQAPPLAPHQARPLNVAAPRPDEELPRLGAPPARLPAPPRRRVRVR